jgi:hypothetical protein
MLHAAKLKRRNEHEVELAELVGNVGVLLEPRERGRMQVEDRLPVPRDLLRVGFAMEHSKRPAVALGGFNLEFAGGERKEVRRDWLRFCIPDAHAIARGLSRGLGAVRDGQPFRWQGELQRVPRLDVQLVEARECEARPGRHEDRVKEIGIAIERCVTRAKHDVERVFAHGQLFLWDDDVTVDFAVVRRLSTR